VSTFSRCTVLAEFRCKWSSCCRSVTWRRSSSLHARRLAWKHTRQHWHHIPDTIPDNMYCEIIFIRWTFNFVFLVSWVINEFMISTKYLFTLEFSYIAYNLKPTNSSVHKHVHRRQFTKLCAHEMKWFYSITQVTPSTKVGYHGNTTHAPSFQYVSLLKPRARIHKTS